MHIKGHQASWRNFRDVHRNFSSVCDAGCQRQVLKIDVPSLDDLCARSPAIRSGYSKCAMAGKKK